MRILIATPLYPPDVAPSAPYVKELATRLSTRHEVTILAYGHIPESIPCVHIVTVEKRAPLLIRMTHFAKELVRKSRHADVLIIENGPSVEVPFVLFGSFLRKKKIFQVSDTVAEAHAHNSFFYRVLFSLAKYTAHITHKNTNTILLSRPEIHPLKPYPEKEFAVYEESWNKHIAIIESQLV